jgi:hypothetical protein
VSRQVYGSAHHPSRVRRDNVMLMSLSFMAD